MAYQTKYTALWQAENKSGTLVIQEKDYVGTSETIRLQFDAIRITKQLENWESHIIGDVCEFNVVNDRADYFDLLDLMLATEKKYKVIVTCTYQTVVYTLFSGFINTEVTTQKYLHKSIIRLVASSFVSKLENVYPEEINTIEPITFINVFTTILQQAGNVYNIRVASYLLSGRKVYENGKSFMNSNGINSEIFWKNNVDRIDSKTILEQILTTFQCYLYFWNGYWYIESFDALFFDHRFYVEYTYNVSYSPVSVGTDVMVIYPVTDIHNLVFTDTTQTLTTKPGNRTVEIRVNQQPYYNLTINDFIGIVKTVSQHLDPTTIIRQWRAYQPLAQTYMVWSAQGQPYKKMINSIRRTSSYVNECKVIDIWPISLADADYNPNTYNDLGYLWNGLSTSFRADNEEFADTSLQISWKYSQGDLRSLVGLSPTELTEVGAGGNWSYRKISVLFQYYIQVFDSVTGYWLGSLHYDDDLAVWSIAPPANPTLTIPNDYVGSHVIVEETEFDRNHICDVKITVPLSEVLLNAAPLPLGSYVFTLVVCTERIRWYKDSAPLYSVKRYDRITNDCYYGDILISASIDTYDENIITGTTNTDFLNKMEISLDIADAENFNYKNGILEGNNLDVLTSVWWRNDTIDRKIVDYILIDKFRMGSITRQRLIGNIKTPDILKPFAMFTDSKQSNKKFLLTGIVYDVTKDDYEIVLDEYDSDTVINLIEA